MAEKSVSGKSRTRVIGVISGKGGVGKTTFAANLGIALNAFGEKTLIVDCNVTTPHLRYYLGVKDFSTTLNNIFAGEIDASFAPLSKEGVMFIPASERFEDLKRVDMKNLRSIIRQFANEQRFDFIILDSAPGLGREAIGTLQACDEIVFVTVPTVPNVMDIVRSEEVARILGHKKFYMVFNMVRNKPYELQPEKAEEIFGIPVLGSIPFDETIMDATAEGVPIMHFKPGCRACDHFMYIAANLAGIDLETTSRREESISIEEEVGEVPKDAGRLEPIIDKGYEYVQRRSKRGLRSRLRHRIDKKAGEVAGKIKNALGR